MSPDTPDATDLESQIGRWRGYVQGHQAITPSDVDELEHHLRDQVAALHAGGLTVDEAFLVAVTRMGSLDEVSREFAREHGDRLWKQLVLSPSAGASGVQPRRRELLVVLGLAVAAAVAVKVPALFGHNMEEGDWFYPLNLSLFSLPFLAAYLAWKRDLTWASGLRWLALPFLLGAVVANCYPYSSGGSTEVLVAIHLPIALWFTVGLAYVAGDWHSLPRRMEFVRFTGEWVVYYTLLALGGGVLVGLTSVGFSAIGLDADVVLAQWVLPCGAVGAVVVAAWLVEAKQDVVENIAPVLTLVFTPLAVLMLLAYLVALLATGDVVTAERELLIVADVVLVLALGLLLYALSARDLRAAPALFDRLQLALVLLALTIDVMLLSAMLGRIAEFGASPNKAASLGLNLLLLVNLGGSAGILLVHWRRSPFSTLERWQTRYLLLFAAWAAVVAVVFPPVFGWA